MKGLLNGTWHGDMGADPGLLAGFRAAEKDNFRHWITADGTSDFAAEPGRYHLYVSHACPWANRAITYRKLKGLEDGISMSVAHPVWGGPMGWTFADTEFSTRDHAGSRDYLHEIYQAAKPNFTGKVTVPVLWDKKSKAIVNKESGDIIRILDSAFDAWGDASARFYPDDLAADIEAMNARILPKVCMGVYKCGFAGEQAAYDDAVGELFTTLDELDARLSAQPYLLGGRITESDWHLFMTLVRFDAVYHTRLKCTVRRLTDYPNLSRYTRR